MENEPGGCHRPHLNHGEGPGPQQAHHRKLARVDHIGGKPAGEGALEGMIPQPGPKHLQNDAVVIGGRKRLQSPRS